MVAAKNRYRHIFTFISWLFSLWQVPYIHIEIHSVLVSSTKNEPIIIQFAFFLPSYRSLFASKAIKAGDCILKVPFSAVCSRTAYNSIKAFQLAIWYSIVFFSHSEFVVSIFQWIIFLQKWYHWFQVELAPNQLLLQHFWRSRSWIRYFILFLLF